jgi:diacylglycerol O-acyltransferase / wax synthase
MTAPLYTNEADPIRRLRATREALSQMKERYRALPAELLQDANQFIPPAMFSRAARLTFVIASSGRGRPAWNLVVSNVPGPQFPLYMAGARSAQANGGDRKKLSVTEGEPGSRRGG